MTISRVCLLLLVLSAFGCAPLEPIAIDAPPVRADATGASAAGANGRTPRPKQALAAVSELPPATATTDFIATAANAEAVSTQAIQTAESARLEAARITQDANQLEAARTQQANDLILQQGSWTQQAEQQAFTVAGWTATAADTAIPLTQTARVEDNARTEKMLAVSSGMLTATYTAPTQMVTMARAQAEARTAEAERWAFVYGIFSASTITLALAALLLRYLIPARRAELEHMQQVEVETRKPAPLPLKPLETGPVFSVETVAPGFVKLDVSQNLATPEQLAEMADRVINRGESLAVNNYEGKETSWTRKAFYRFRPWLQARRYVRSAGQGQIVVTDSGEAFFRAVLAQHSPTEAAVTPSHSRFAEIMSRDREDRGYESGGGVVDMPRGTPLVPLTDVQEPD